MIKLSRAAAAAADSDRWRRVTRRRPSAEDAEWPRDDESRWARTRPNAEADTRQCS